MEITIVLTPEEFQPYLVRAAESLSRDHKVAGFRPGKLPLAMALKQFGEKAVYEEAAEPAIRDSYARAVREHDLKTVGSPHIELTTLAPNEPLRFTATVSVLPEVTLPDLTNITIARRAVSVPASEIDRVLEDLRKMQPKEALVDRAAEAKDKVIVDLDLKKENVPIEGGQAKQHQIYLAEEYYLPNIREAIVGMAKGETKTLPIEFPKDHFQKHLAGSKVDATVTLHDVYTVELPVLDDAFAKSIGQPDIATLRKLVEQNLTNEATKKSSDAEEVDLLDQTIAGAKFDELPELLITGQARQMIEELEEGVGKQGVPFADYLQQIKKTRDQLLLEMAPEAVKRVKAALLTRAIGEQQAIAPDEQAVDAEIQAQLEHYTNEPEVRQRIQSEESREYVRMLLRNRGVISWLRGQVQWKG